MPIIKSAIKALKQSKKHEARNRAQKNILKTTIKKTAGEKDLAKAQSKIDRAAKTGLIHKNKAARLKSRLAKKTKK